MPWRRRRSAWRGRRWSPPPADTRRRLGRGLRRVNSWSIVPGILPVDGEADHEPFDSHASIDGTFQPPGLRLGHRHRGDRTGRRGGLRLDRRQLGRRRKLRDRAHNSLAAAAGLLANDLGQEMQDRLDMLTRPRPLPGARPGGRRAAAPALAATRSRTGAPTWSGSASPRPLAWSPTAATGCWSAAT